jgi:hypothetical protein
MKPDSDIRYQISDIHNGNLKVAIVCDWLVGGGAEKVVLELHRMFPEAPIYIRHQALETRAGRQSQNWLFAVLALFSFTEIYPIS